MTEKETEYVPSVAEILGEVASVVEVVEDAQGLGKLMLEEGVPENLGAITLTLKATDITIASAGISLVFALTGDEAVREAAKSILATMEQEQIAVEDQFTNEQNDLIANAQLAVADKLINRGISSLVPDTIPEELADGGLGSA